MSRRKQANPKSLRIPLDLISGGVVQTEKIDTETANNQEINTESALNKLKMMPHEDHSSPSLLFKNRSLLPPSPSSSHSSSSDHSSNSSHSFTSLNKSVSLVSMKRKLNADDEDENINIENSECENNDAKEEGEENDAHLAPFFSDSLLSFSKQILPNSNNMLLNNKNLLNLILNHTNGNSFLPTSIPNGIMPVASAENSSGDSGINSQQNNNKQPKPDHLSQTGSLQLSDQNSTSFIFNGKRYYRLKYVCEACGLRYSDQSTLNAHKLNYCSKRDQNSDHSSSSSESSLNVSNSFISSSSSSSSSSACSSRSNSPSPSQTSSSNSNQSMLPAATQQKILSNSLEIENNSRPNTTGDIQLLKSVIYQCNNCLFQTDKKSIMNRHSRVHLPQKRKQMEMQQTDSASSPSAAFMQTNKNGSSSLSTAKATMEDDNENNTTYCRDCDIQFSSVKTYMHHRTNYCQKYKTIEAIVPVEVGKDKAAAATATARVMATTKLVQPKQQSFVITAQTNNQTAKQEFSTNQQASNKFSPDSVAVVGFGSQQKNQQSNITKNCEQSPKSNLTSESTATDDKEKDKPLDLSIKKPTSKLSQTTAAENQFISTQHIAAAKNYFQQQQLLNFVTSSNLAPKLLQNQHNQLLKPSPLPPAHPSSVYLGNPQLLLPPLPQPSQLPRLQPLAHNPFLINPAHALIHHHNQSNEPSNRIYHCKVCQQLFLKFKSFKRHTCFISNQKALASMTPTNMQPPKLIVSSASPPPLQNIQPKPSTNNSESNPVIKGSESSSKNDNNNKTDFVINENNKITTFKLPSNRKCEADNLIKHPLVNKTLIEIYGREDLDCEMSGKLVSNALVNTNNGTSVNLFFMCTTCGYRGNTARGVKQHGKLHLATRQHFAIIQAMDSRPVLIYNSQNECDFVQSTNKAVNMTTVEELALTLTQDIKSSEADKQEKSTSNLQHQQKPISKKARLLLDYSKKLREEEEKELELKLNEQKREKEEKEAEKLKVKSHTYCFKCCIQFQHMSNYLAHKKSYCIDQ